MMPSRPPPVEICLSEYKSISTSDLTREQAETLREREGFGEYITVRPAWEPDCYELTAKQYVGIIVLEDVRINIKPKVPVGNLFYMLTYAYDLPEFRREEAGREASEDLFEFIVIIFVRQVGDLVRRGLYRNYITYDEEHTFLRGRLLMAEHLRRNAVQPQRFSQRIHEYTADILENQILRFTLDWLSRLNYEYRSKQLRQLLRRTLSAFGEVSFIPIRPEMCDQVSYTRLNDAYRWPISLARLLLQHLSLEGRPGEVPFAAFLFDMNEVFERFVARYLEDYFATHRPECQVKSQCSIKLDDERKESGIPDIILQKNGQRCLVLDTKYKRFNGAPEEADRNQMFMYCHALGLSHGILIYPNDQPISYRRQFQHVTLSARALSLAGSLDEFKGRCERFAEELAQVIEQQPG